MLDVVLVYTLLIAFMMVSTIPTYSGKLLGERISREYVLPLFMLVIGFVALFITYPFGTLTGACLAYLATIPISWRRYGQMLSATPPVPVARIRERAAAGGLRCVQTSRRRADGAASAADAG